MQSDIPTSDDIKSALMGRAQAFAASRKMALSTIALKAVNDSKFFSQVQEGRGFNIVTYQRVMDWLDAAEREIPERGAAQ